VVARGEAAKARAHGGLVAAHELGERMTVVTDDGASDEFGIGHRREGNRL
jgi:hypothetical protein